MSVCEPKTAGLEQLFFLFLEVIAGCPRRLLCKCLFRQRPRLGILPSQFTRRAAQLSIVKVKRETQEV